MVSSGYLESFLWFVPYLPGPSNSNLFFFPQRCQIISFPVAFPSGALSPLEHTVLWIGIGNAWLFLIYTLAMPSVWNSWTIKLLGSIVPEEISLVSHQLTSSDFWPMVQRQPCLSDSFWFVYFIKSKSVSEAPWQELDQGTLQVVTINCTSELHLWFIRVRAGVWVLLCGSHTAWLGYPGCCHGFVVLITSCRYWAPWGEQHTPRTLPANHSEHGHPNFGRTGVCHTQGRAEFCLLSSLSGHSQFY